MKWADSLIRISKHEVETLQKRVAEITARRLACERRLHALEAEAGQEAERARVDPDAGWHYAGYMKGWRVMRDQMLQQIAAVTAEEAGARDALSKAFEELKKPRRGQGSRQARNRRHGRDGPEEGHGAVAPGL